MAQPYYPPPQPYYRDPTDVVGKRIGSFFIDAALAVALALITFFAMADQVTLTEALRDHDCEIPEEDLDEDEDDLTTLNCDGKFSIVVDSGNVYLVDLGPYMLLNGGASFLYFAILPGLTGATLGKLATGIRVVKKDTGEIQGIGRSIVRWLFFLVDGPFSLYICGLVTSLVSKGHRRVGDMVAGTFVVDKVHVGQPPMVPGLTGPAMPSGPYGVPPGYGYGPTPGYPVPPGYPAPPGYPSPPGYPTPPGYPAPPGGPPSGDAPAPTPWGPPPAMGPPVAPPAWPAGPADAPASPTADAPASSTESEAPLPPTQPSDEPTCPQPPAASPTGVPAWDRERGAWMQWDPARGSWMVWNPAYGTWVPA